MQYTNRERRRGTLQAGRWPAELTDKNTGHDTTLGYDKADSHANLAETAASTISAQATSSSSGSCCYGGHRVYGCRGKEQRR